MQMEAQVQAFLAMLAAPPAYASSTRQAYRSDLLHFVNFLQFKVRRSPLLTDFNPQQVEEYLASERQAGRQAGTLQRRAASLRRFARYLQQAGLENPWPIQLTKPPTPATERRSLQVLDLAQIQSLWGTIEASQRPRARRDLAILALLLENGLSASDLVAMDLRDINLLSGKLRLRRPHQTETWLPLGSAARPLQRYLREGRPELNKHPDEPALFISQTSGRMSRQGIWQALRQWGSRANLEPALSPRLVRHTAAWRMAQSDRPIREIQCLLGHSNLLSTQALIHRLTSPAVEGKAESDYE